MALYRDKLADWDASYPVRPAGRLWLRTPAAAAAPKVRRKAVA
jgi:hypothetical protein